MRTIFISAGHSNTPGRDRGAVGNGFIEGNLTVEFRNLIISELAKIGVKAERDGDNTVTAETVNFIRKKLFGINSIFIDFHFNAGPSTATGCEVIVPDNPSEFEWSMAQDISATISNVLGIRNRLPKSESKSARSKLAWMRTTGENILPEVCFITNSADMASYQKNKNELASALAAAIKKWAQQ